MGDFQWPHLGVPGLRPDQDDLLKLAFRTGDTE